MYLAEAEKQDKEITEAWKGEADSILVFVSSSIPTLSASINKTIFEDWSLLRYCRRLHNRKLQEAVS